MKHWRLDGSRTFRYTTPTLMTFHFAVTFTPTTQKVEDPDDEWKAQITDLAELLVQEPDELHFEENNRGFTLEFWGLCSSQFEAQKEVNGVRQEVKEWNLEGLLLRISALETFD